GPVFDERIGEVFSSGDLEGLFDFDEDFCDRAAECGLRSFQIMAGAIDGLGFQSQMLSNEGPFGVGYGVATCFPLNNKRCRHFGETPQNVGETSQNVGWSRKEET
ncbi:MAG: hypothetical protein J5818_06940, partial [Eggerthellaceae bacterium]|nr:hypothetical protein [Eggerthellaceae bacterium]